MSEKKERQREKRGSERKIFINYSEINIRRWVYLYEYIDVITMILKGKYKKKKKANF